ncbi:MAG: prolyl oligopeptidase family serine peptidase [Myxococcota bacterium]|nr:prolyl oligopeptidase family serine peptidase [Myxococcota bacterium]
MRDKIYCLISLTVAIAVYGCCPSLQAPIPDVAKVETQAPASPPPSDAAKPSGPPIAKFENVVDEHWGVQVDDPYRYMENMEDPYVQDWFKQQAAYAEKRLSKLLGRDELLTRIKELDKNKQYRIFNIRRDPKGTLFYKKLNAGENISKLYWVDAKTKEERLLLDPEALKKEGDQHYSMGAYAPAPDLKHVVYGLAQGGSEETTYHVIEVKTSKVLDVSIDRIETAYNSPQWSEDSQGFFYARRQKLSQDAPATDIYKKTKVYYHRLGTPADSDQLIAEMGLSDKVVISDVDFPSLTLPAKSPFAILKIKHGDSNPLTLYTAPKRTLLNKNIPWVKICDATHQVDEFTVFGNQIYLRTSLDAPKYKVVKTNLHKPDFQQAKIVIPEGDHVINSIAAAKTALYVGIMDAGIEKIIKRPYNKPGTEVLALPDGASGLVVSVNQKIENPFVYTNFWTKGSKIYEYQAKKGTFRDTELLPKGKFDNVPGFASKEVKVKSHDGVLVPLSIVYPEKVKLDGKNPALVIGYGSYGLSINVRFSAIRLAWLERGGILAYAHVRGGGENGKQWHLDGQKSNKHNTWKDFIACIEYLIAEGYTSKGRVAGQGGSAGGILIGRTITERPDLLRAAIINVGALDTIRAETTTNGVPNIMEFGTVKNEQEFKGLLEMSAYHNVKDGVSYPAVLLTHGINDPRVNPWMSGKMAARLQAANAGDRPIIFRVDYEAGHGIGSRRDQMLEQLADEWTFLLRQFD